MSSDLHVGMLSGFSNVPSGEERNQISVSFRRGSAVFNIVSALMMVSGQSQKMIIEYIVLDWIKNREGALSSVIHNDPDGIKEALDNGRD